MFTLYLDSRHFLVTWSLSCEKNNPGRFDVSFLGFQCMRNSVFVGSSIET